jgi:hypothetical protein
VETLDYSCPICGKAGPFSPRYPRCICVECGHRATDEDGRGLSFTNEAVSGGFIATYRDTGEVRDSHICIVDGVRCWVDEAHMGGIVVRLYDPETGKI